MHKVRSQTIFVLFNLVFFLYLVPLPAHLFLYPLLLRLLTPLSRGGHTKLSNESNLLARSGEFPASVTGKRYCLL